MEARLNLNQHLSLDMCQHMIRHYQQLLNKPNQHWLARLTRRNSLRYWQKQYDDLLLEKYYHINLN